MKPVTVAVLTAVVLASAVSYALRAPIPEPRVQTPRPPLLSARADPAVLRNELLKRRDAEIDAIATKSRLDARALLDAVIPIPYFGVDSQPKNGGLVLEAVYADTGAERCGMKKGDILRTFGGVVMDSRATLARTVRTHEIGEVVEVRFERDGKPMTVQATLAPRPEEDEDEVEQFPDLIPPAPVPPAGVALDFEDEPIGTLPARLFGALGGHGKDGVWIVVKGDSGNALRQDDPDPTGVRFPMALVRDFDAYDARGSVKFRYVGGRVDRAGGIVLRYRDPGNYLCARANLAEGDLRIFRVVNGDRRTLPGAIAKGATDDDEWHTLEFSAIGHELTAVLDGTVRATAVDTFFLHGGVGLWTKSDSRTEFDDLRFEATR